MCIHSAVANGVLAFPKVDFNLVCALWEKIEREREREKKRRKKKKEKKKKQYEMIMKRLRLSGTG